MRCPECRFKLPPAKTESRYVKCNNCLTMVNVHTRAVLESAKPTFHHPDHETRESRVSEIEVSCNLVKPTKFSDVTCIMCAARVSEITTIQGSLLSMSTRVEKYTETDLSTGEQIEFEKHIKFPTYKSGYICQDDIVAFTHLCNSYDDWGHVKAKLKYVPVTDSKLSDDIIAPISTSQTYNEAVPRWDDGTLQDSESVFEIVDVKKQSQPVMKFKRVEFKGQFASSPQELNEKKSKVAKLQAPVQNVNGKFGKPERTRKR